MLFFLTGQVQTGKTRWLEALVGNLADWGVQTWGVLAPGVWARNPADGTALSATGKTAHGEALPAFEVSKMPSLEKVGIDNVLLPSKERIAFARRNDLARAAGVFDAASQSARANLAWCMDDAAIMRVNDHFSKIACLARRTRDAARHADGRSFSAFLVIDELGMLELVRGEGLTEAVALVDAGATSYFPHALVVVREQLVECAYERFPCMLWGGARILHADDEGRIAALRAFGFPA